MRASTSSHRDPLPVSTSGTAKVLRGLRLLLVLLVGSGIVVVAITYLLPVLHQHRLLKTEEAEVHSQLEVLRDMAAREEMQLHWMRNDDAYLEILARDRLDLQKSGETIIRFQDQR